MSEPPARRPRPSPGPTPSAEPAPTSRTARRQAAKRADQQARLRRLRWVMLAAVIVAVAAGTASAVVALSGGDGGKAGRTNAATSPAAGSGARLTQPDVATAFLAGASSDIVAVTSYDYRRLDDALAAGSAVTTGAYHDAFRAALTGDLGASARADRVVHDFQVLDLGIGEMSADGRQAKVLIFGRQLASDRTHPQPQGTVLTLCATMQHEGERYLISDLRPDADPGVPPGSPELAAAIEAGRTEVVNALTYTRAQFDADLRRALAGAADPLRGELQTSAAATRAAMEKGKYDLNGVVVASAVKDVAPHSVTLLVAAESSQLAAGGSRVTPVRYEVSVRYANGSWAATQIQTLGAQ